MVTLVTQCSMDRFKRLEEQALAYGDAPISVAIYVPFDACESTKFTRVKQFYAELVSRGVRHLTISILCGNAPSEDAYDSLYPVNALRNLALKAATSQLVFLVDVDFVPSRRFSNVHQEDRSFLDACKCGAVLIVPAFEFSGSSKTPVPRTFNGLASSFRKSEARVFDIGRSPGHVQTNFSRWILADTPYFVNYEWKFEPYIIAWRERVPWYDEKFRGYGMNKIVHLYEVAQRGAHFIVLPKVFIIARKHHPSSSKRIWHADRDRGSTRLDSLTRAFKRDVIQGVQMKGGPDLNPGTVECNSTLTSFVRWTFGIEIDGLGPQEWIP